MDIAKKDLGGNAEAEVVLYQPDSSIHIEVLVEGETVWLTQQQMSELFSTTRNNITLHIRNIFNEGELDEDSVCKESLRTAADGKKYRTKFYNLDVIISVGYRVKSIVGTKFRQWANSVLRQYLLRGYAVHQQLMLMESRIEGKLCAQHDEIQTIKAIQQRQQEQLDFFIRTSTPPAEMVFFEGDFYTARAALENLVKSALHRVVIIDGYVSALTLDILDVRAKGVEAVIYTSGVGAGMQRLMQEHDRLFPSPEEHIDIRKCRKESHDRWLVVDDKHYHCGHSLNANGGHKISAITLMGTSPEAILGQVR